MIRPDDRVGQQQALLDTTHAFVLFTAQYGHRTADVAFQQSGVPATLSWQSAAPHLPAPITAAARVTLPRDERYNCLDEITAVDNHFGS
ncbi:hypothetical protein [Streptomyces longisporoflavus]|uniref:Uncharacterized protein n=1 Tax=Streptomyces longisporoflavus TaxID=28044 RepID=A0ABW7R3I1_9ACTN